ncbi:hypothetical protein INS49_015438 [Diaporthe citri]|uniref:uncharacterized protein n=1 Tax=Diaporthe citri TaxID=83186 RepID=UPI001C823082|nr:uncharacterized protein INS49_015438 [Diaporthe citri]KAG6356053.1 hypothetical protein INS49_015438 [Diaporthe citri]
MSPDSSSNIGQAPGHTGKKPIGDKEDEWDTNSVTKGYYRMTASDAQKYVEGLRQKGATKELEKLEDDERRIMKTCARLSKNTSTKKLQKDLKNSFQEWCNEMAAKEEGDDDDPAHDMKAYFIFFEKIGKDWKGKTKRDPGFPEYEEFPDQRISIHDALNSDTHNPFKPTHDETGNPYLRYIHIPANHTGWIEKAMARYHEEDRDIPEKRVKTNKTLSRQFWKGQLHGSGLGRNPIHATHMRSRCSVIPGEIQSLFGEQKESSNIARSQGGVQGKKSPSKDLAIFMPYLHWEMSGRRARMSKAVKEMLEEEETKNENSRYRAKRSATIKQDVERYKNLFQVKDHENYVMARKMLKKTINPTKLGQYLLNLARLWDAMDMELDERMVKHGLISQNTKGSAPEPLLHIRRTLDQSYFLNLKDTSQRDLDQVVYRATKGYGSHTRVVMVDQLWLWVLDEHTVITSFPKRWGRNKPDSSGIHKSLRERLGQADCKIMSAWHLASIIIDQCSNVFFDRTKPLDLRPEVMDIFAETLGDVNHYTTIAFKVFWHSVDVFTRNRDNRTSHRQSQKYLDINPEGTLLKEAQDIVEELKIMIGIFSQQLGVVKNFQKCLEHMNGDPTTRSRAPHLTKAFLHHVAAWATEHDSSSEVSKEKPVSLAEMEFLEDLVEEVENRKSEIMDLESAALQTCHQAS